MLFAWVLPNIIRKKILSLFEEDYLMSVSVKNFTQTFIWQWIVSFSICAVVHIPYFFGKHCSFDGDEAIVGIMSQDLLSGRNIPVYFYGQQYGFSFFEVIGVAIAMIFFGNTVWSLKLGSLIVYSVGVAFLFRFFSKNKISFIWMVISVLIISCFPAWIIWSAKARGGYVTAFSAVCALFYVIQTKKANIKWIFIAAFIFVIGLHAQLIITACISFLFFGWIFKTKKFGLIILSLLTIVGFYFILKIPAWYNSNYWTAPFVVSYHYADIYPFVRELYKTALGYFYYEMAFKPRIESVIFGAGYYLIAMVLCVVCFIKEKDHRTTFILLSLGSIAAFFMVMGMRIPTHRYFFGLFTGSMVIFVLAMFQILKGETKSRFVFLFMLPFAFGSVNTSKHIPDSWFLPEANDMKLYNELVGELNKRNIHHVFVTEPLLQWMLSYGGINARYTSPTERINRYLKKVDLCYLDPQCKTAIVGYTGYYNYMDSGTWNEEVLIVNEKYFIYEQPGLSTLKAGGYEFSISK